MPGRIEHYGVIGDTQTVALVGRDASIDWLCLPRFDSGACFAALLGNEAHGRWQLVPTGTEYSVRRRYRGHSLVLETEFTTPEGVAHVVDCMPPRGTDPDVVRMVEGVRGRVAFRMELVLRFDYGSAIPWVRSVDGELRGICGPDAVRLVTPVTTHGRDRTTVAEFSVDAGQQIPFVLTWHPSHEPPPRPIDAARAVADTERWWTAWADRSTYDGGWTEAVTRSLLTLKALTYAPTGGIVAAPTTSLPEQIGGVRNWDYRYCWLRDATFTLYALMLGGYEAEAVAWRDWLLRAVAGAPEQLRIMYGAGGERRLVETELGWLPGYEGSRPVRVGNAAAEQHQLDVYGEVMDALHQGRRIGIPPDAEAWRLQQALMDVLEGRWREPDEGIWEVRGPRRHFTHSKVMAWVAADRAVRAVEEFAEDGPLDRWRRLRSEIHAEVCSRGWDPDRRTFTQWYGSSTLDAALLLLPLVGFLPADDHRMRGTVEAVERTLREDGLVHRYDTDTSVDGLPAGEGAFLACTFWLADNYAMQGRRGDAVATFEHLLGLRNDLGLLAEEWDAGLGRQVGNFPQAFSHVPLINTARNLSRPGGPAEQRRCEADAAGGTAP